MHKASRKNRLIPDVVFVDGLSGSGKTALLMTLSSFDRIEVARFEHTYEYVCALSFLQCIKEGAASSLIRLHLDIACYNTMISREVNFRPTDISCVLQSSKRAQYIERLFLPDQESVISRLSQERPIFHIMTHAALGIAKPIFEALEDHFAFIEIVRHPLFLIPAWYSYIDRYGTDPLEFTICFDYKDRDLPWFALGWEKVYLESNKMDRIIRSIEFITNQKRHTINNLSELDLQRIALIPFEKFVVDPWPYIKIMEKLLNARHTSMTEKILKEQNIPRKISMDIPEHEAFRKYGYVPLSGESTEDTEIDKQWKFIKQEASPEGINILRKLSDEYEREYLNKA